MPRGETAHLKPYQFKPGVSGNPSGKPKGKTMKQYARDYLANMTEEDRIAFLNSLSHDKIWEMAEGKAKQDIEIEGEMTSKVINVDE